MFLKRARFFRIQLEERCFFMNSQGARDDGLHDHRVVNVKQFRATWIERVVGERESVGDPKK